MFTKEQIYVAASELSGLGDATGFIEKCESYTSNNHWLKQELTEDQVLFAARTTLSEEDATKILTNLGLSYNNDMTIAEAIKTMGREELNYLIKKIYKQGRLDYASKVNDVSFEDGQFLDECEDFIYRNWDDYVCNTWEDCEEELVF